MNTEYSGDYIILGPPGCGKTTFLGKQVRRIAERCGEDGKAAPVLLCSLTRTAAAEIVGRGLPVTREQVGTLHSHAYRLLDRPELAEGHSDEWNTDHPHFKFSTYSDASVDDLLVENNRATAGDEAYSKYCLLRARRTPSEVWPSSVKSFAQTWEGWKSSKNYLDFTDLIEVALRDLPHAPGRPEVIIGDEAQDLSRLEIDLLRKWGNAAGALMLAGDPFQALYTWRGAHPTIFNSPEIPKERRKLLAQSYRLSKAVHGLAVQWVKRLSSYFPIEYYPRDVEGSADFFMDGTWRTPDNLLPLIEKDLSDGKTVMVTGSCSYMLGPISVVLRQAGIPFANPWRVKRGDWNPLAKRKGQMTTVDRVLAYLQIDPHSVGDEHRHQWRLAELRQWAQMLQSKGVLRHGVKKLIEHDHPLDGETTDYDTLEMFFETAAFEDLWALCCNGVAAMEGGQPITKDLIKWIKPKLLPKRLKAADYPFKIINRLGAKAIQEPPRLYLGTIHSFKGAEADVVYIFPDLSTSALREWFMPGEGKDSVIRTFYVGITRARERVVFVRPGSKQASIPVNEMKLRTL